MLAATHSITFVPFLRSLVAATKTPAFGDSNAVIEVPRDKALEIKPTLSAERFPLSICVAVLPTLQS